MNLILQVNSDTAHAVMVSDRPSKAQLLEALELLCAEVGLVEKLPTANAAQALIDYVREIRQ